MSNLLTASFNHVKGALQGKHPINVRRSGHWPAVRKAHLEKNPVCAVCGGSKSLEVHHILPFHDKPSEELQPTNLVTLCEGLSSLNCHLVFGHLLNFKSFNINVLKDAAEWFNKITNRPVDKVKK